jgi:transcriptional regulator with XRE-family HTH domain
MRNVTVNSIGEYIREQREQAKISIRQLAQSAGVSNPYLSQIERGLRKPSADILQQIAKGLRISAEALYVQAGILEDRPADSGVRSALLADPQLSERQKQVLIEIYESFRRENAAASGSAEDESAEQETDPAALAAGAPGAEADIVEAIAEAIAEEASAAQASAAEASAAGRESPPDDTSDKSGHTSDQAVPPISDQAVPPIR